MPPIDFTVHMKSGESFTFSTDDVSVDSLMENRIDSNFHDLITKQGGHVILKQSDIECIEY